MAFQIILSAVALKELEASVDWYNARQDDLGTRFIEALDKIGCYYFLKLQTFSRLSYQVTMRL